MTNYYVYYRVEEAEALRPKVVRLFENISRVCGVRGRWMHRRDDPSTYMEVYEGVKDEKAFEALLAREAASLGLARKTETFIDVPDRPGMAR